MDPILGSRPPPFWDVTTRFVVKRMFFQVMLNLASTLKYGEGHKERKGERGKRFNVWKLSRVQTRTVELSFNRLIGGTGK